jgi:DNA repair protein RecN (Recombination protein N)
MLKKLNIQNIAIIDNVNIDFENGFNILTGETGAGKSIIIDSLNAILGERTSKDLIRTGTDKAFIEAFFLVDNDYFFDLFEEFGVEKQDDGTLILQREFSISGKNTCRINGRLVTVSVLKFFGSRLVDVHGQHDNVSLLHTEKHIELLDSFSGNKLKDLKEEYLELLDSYKKIKLRISELKANPAERERRMDILNFQIEEITKAELKPNEDIELSHQRTIMNNAEKIQNVLNSLNNSLYDGSRDNKPCYDIIKTCIKDVSGISQLNSSFEEISGKLEEMSYLIEDITEIARKVQGDIDYTPEILEAVDERIDTITRLKKKYGNTISEILQYNKKLSFELEELINSEAFAEGLIQQMEQLSEKLYKLACELNGERQKAAKVLEEKITSELFDLEIKNAAFKVQIDFDNSLYDGLKNFNKNGLCKVEFLISTNAGEPLKPLSKIASGGEMSRIMLAIKSILAKIDKTQTLIFDEIDTGISGKAAQKVGTKLSCLSIEHQVICITHLPQIASLADAHYLIEKTLNKDSTYTQVLRLGGDSLHREIARIIGGDNISDITLKHAAEMLESASKIKRALKTT